MQVGKYTLVRKIATGGMAEVYLARAAGPMGFEKTLVVKRILPHLAEDEAFIQMFLAEAKLAAQLNHPNVVQIFDFGESDGQYFIAMEHIDGPNLRGLSRRATELQRKLPFALCAKTISLAAEGLSYAHDFADPVTGEPLGLIHRDISPDNILIARNGAVKVVDFGIAKAAGQTHHTKTGTLKGKLSYMPPEQLQAKPLDRRADVFALGMVLYELVTGAKPFEATNEISIMQAILHEPLMPAVVRRADVPPALQTILDRALAKDREERYPSCREMQIDLERFILSLGEPVGTYQLATLVTELAVRPAAAVATPAVGGSGSKSNARTEAPPPATPASADTRQPSSHEAAQPAAPSSGSARHNLNDAAAAAGADLARTLPATETARALPGAESARIQQGADVQRTQTGADAERTLQGTDVARAQPGNGSERTQQRTDVALTQAPTAVSRPERTHVDTGTAIEAVKPNRTPAVAAAIAIVGLAGAGAWLVLRPSPSIPEPLPARTSSAATPSGSGTGSDAKAARGDTGSNTAGSNTAAPAAVTRDGDAVQAHAANTAGAPGANGSTAAAGDSVAAEGTATAPTTSAASGASAADPTGASDASAHAGAQVAGESGATGSTGSAGDPAKSSVNAAVVAAASSKEGSASRRTRSSKSDDVRPATAKAGLASFRVESVPSAQLRVNGQFVGVTPVQVTGIKPGEVALELYDSRLGVRKKQSFNAEAGDNGTKKIVVASGTLEFRVRPYATVMLDDKTLGQTPFEAVTVYEGTHTIRLINKDLDKDVSVKFEVKPGANVFKYNLAE